MNINNNDNNLVSYILLLIVLFILIFFTKDIAVSIYSNISEKQTLETQLEEVREQRKYYTNLKTQLESGQWEQVEQLKKYATVFKQDEFIDFIYNYVETTNIWGSSAVIKSLHFSEPVENEIGFMQVDVDVNMKVSNLATMASILDFLVSDAAKYKIFITDFSYPNTSLSESFNINIPLTIFYK